MSSLPDENALPLTDGERRQVQRLLSDPLSFPIEFRAWLKAFTELEEEPERRAPAGVGGGIQFDIDNIGGYLRVFTNANDGEQNPNGIWLDTSLDPTARLLLTSGLDIELSAERDINVMPQGDLFMRGEGTVSLRSGASNLNLNGATGVSITSSNGDITMSATTGDVVVFTGGSGKTLALRSDAGPVAIRGVDVGSVIIFGNTNTQLSFAVENSVALSIDVNYTMTSYAFSAVKPGHNLSLMPGTSFRLHDSTLEYLRVDNVGGVVTYHIRAGAVWATDL